MKIKRPKWNGAMSEKSVGDCAYAVTQDLDYWFNTYVEPINKMLEDAVEVHTYKNDGVWYKVKEPVNPTHKALLINIEPIKKETAKDILRDLYIYHHKVGTWCKGSVYDWEHMDKFFKRYSELLEEDSDVSEG